MDGGGGGGGDRGETFFTVSANTGRISVTYTTALGAPNRLSFSIEEFHALMEQVKNVPPTHPPTHPPIHR